MLFQWYNVNQWYALYLLCRDISELYSKVAIQRAENSICYVMWRPFSGVGWGEIVPYIIGYYFKTHYYTLFPFFFVFVLTWLNFVLRLGGCSKVRHLPNRLSSYVFFFLVNKRFKPEIDFNYKKPQVLRWWHLKHARKPIAYFSYHQKKTKSHY